MIQKATNYIDAHCYNRDDDWTNKKERTHRVHEDQNGKVASLVYKLNIRDSKQLRCFICDKVGHKSVNCRAKTQPRV